jgi:hypothetical protein
MSHLTLTLIVSYKKYKNFQRPFLEFPRRILNMLLIKQTLLDRQKKRLRISGDCYHLTGKQSSLILKRSDNNMASCHIHQQLLHVGVSK